MADHSVIAAQVVDIQNDRQHKGSIKITLHVPAEAGAHLTDVLGWPTYTCPVPVALARLVEQKEIAQQSPPSPTPIKAGTRIPVAVAADKRLAQRAGILSTDPQFHKYLCATGNYDHIIMTEQHAAEYIRILCNVDSRSKIIPGTPAAVNFDAMYSKFIAWRDHDKYVEQSA
jgi:hypothetical protein